VAPGREGRFVVIIILKIGAPASERDAIVSRLHELGFGANVSGTEHTVIGAIGVPEDAKSNLAESFEARDWVERVVPVTSKYKLASRQFQQENTVVRVGNAMVGGERLVVMAGPCSVETREQLLETAEVVAAAGATVLRGGAYKPRTSPYDFQGHGEDGLKIMQEARERFGLAIVTEVMDPHDVELVASYADLLQIGARNMQNYVLLREVGKSRRPVMVKRGGMYPTIENWLLAAEYVLSEGNREVILCERGLPVLGDTAVRRNLLDLTAVPIAKELSHLPVIVDPSHGTGRHNLVSVMSKGAVAVGADGLIIEVHPHPEQAWSDGAQSLRPEVFGQLMRELPAVAQAAGRSL
jgi:3-deoxy-7-phosphoheptulonate synthase